jgi:hypothetical protein
MKQEQRNKFSVAITDVRVVIAIIAGAIYENHGICSPDFCCARYRIAARAAFPIAKSMELKPEV